MTNISEQGNEPKGYIRKPKDFLDENKAVNVSSNISVLWQESESSILNINLESILHVTEVVAHLIKFLF
jgi:hypothetical protein